MYRILTSSLSNNNFLKFYSSLDDQNQLYTKMHPYALVHLVGTSILPFSLAVQSSFQSQLRAYLLL